ncbi:hypothetical protein [Prochlorococcus sp. MIT 1201]|uniref:hypothetical protein n=1 Tax=Prochlorococcus sp. MIT 1201 TaxID=3082535 RepID=UPI0039A49E62
MSRSGSNRLQIADLLAQNSQLSSKHLASTSSEAATPSAFERHAAKSPEFSKELSKAHTTTPTTAAQNLIRPNRMLQLLATAKADAKRLIEPCHGIVKT